MFNEDFYINRRGNVVGELHRECIGCHTIFFNGGVKKKHTCQSCRAKNRLSEPYNKRVWFIARQRARETGLEFNIEPEDIVMPDYCPILGIKLEVNRQSNGLDNSPSLDRKDNSKGYVKGNVWVISNLANKMKNSASPEQIVKFSKWGIAEYEKSR